MAAYAALVSLTYVVDHIEHHPRPPISLDKQQTESLTGKVTFLQQFLEGYSHVAGYSNEADALESRIVDAAHAAEDIIESHIVDQILAVSTSHPEKSLDFFERLQKVIEDMDSIEKEAMEIKEKMGVKDKLHGHSTSVGSPGSSSTAHDTSMLGLDDVLIEILDKLTRGRSNRQIIWIVGMGGIGKTTLARNIYRNQVVVQHFDILGWVTISHEYRMREILKELLQEGGESLSQMNENELGDKLYQKLLGRRYLIMMDDIWDIKVWDKLKRFFPNNDNGSRIMLTSRLSKLGSQVPNSDSIHMDFLDEGNSWNLFSKIVFGEDGCPLELKELGKRIVANCKGLPLSIVVIGGILAKSNQAQHYWEHIAENLNAIVNSEDDERCLKILHMSYKQLPVHLKPCFLYMGVFPEDATIRVSMLIKLWVAEGFLKPISGKSLEEVAEECLKELINRNLVLVNKFGSTGNIKYCSMHDLLSDLCLREAQKERLYCVPLTQHYLKTNTQRRLIIPSLKLATKALHSMFLALNDFQSISSTRSLIFCRKGVISSLNFRLLRILKAVHRDAYYEEKYFLENTFQLVNSRYLAIRAHPDSKFPASVHLLWNLHTLIVKNNQDALTAPVDIWNMPQLRNVEFDRLYLPDPPRVHGHDDIVLGNLRTLFRIRNFKCSEEVVKRIPNLKKLKLYVEVDGNLRYGLRNLRHLHKLESFSCYSEPRIQPPRDGFLQNLTFPQSLKKLSLDSDHVYWDDILDEIGSLPLLEKLKLLSGSFRRLEWRTVDGQFRSLKFLLISRCKNLISWTMENSHFPRLKHLDLRHLHYLEEIPSSVGDIPTLQSMELVNCNDNVIISAKRILKEQEEVGNQSLHIRVSLFQKNQVLQSLASTNFQVECI